MAQGYRTAFDGFPVDTGCSPRPVSVLLDGDTSGDVGLVPAAGMAYGATIRVGGRGTVNFSPLATMCSAPTASRERPKFGPVTWWRAQSGRTRLTVGIPC